MSRLIRGVWLGAVVLLGACAESPTSPARRPSIEPQFSAASLTPVQWIPNTKPYRDPTHHFATGRSGLATLSARALLGKDGRTAFEVSTGDVNTNTAGTQQLQKVQLKVFNRAGVVAGTYNDNNLSVTGKTYDLPGLSPGQRLQVQANVLVPNVTARNDRTGVVTLSEPVLLRPDLHVTATIPAQGIVSVPITMSADVHELNGQVSAYADCILYVDGVAVDRAPHIFVGEGDIVNCRFSYAFATLGEHQVKVAAEHVVPGDWDTANNSVTATIRIINNDYRPLTGSWSAGESQYHRYFRRYGQEYDVWYSIQSWDYADYWEEDNNDTQGVNVSAYVYETLGFPLTASVSITSDGNTLFTYDGALTDWGWDPDYGGCADASVGQGFSLSVCDYGGGYNEVYLGFTRGVAIYAAQGYWRDRTVINGYDFGWYTHWYSGHATDYGPKLTFGNQVGVSLVINGTRVAYGTNQSGVLQPYGPYSWSSPWSCRPTNLGQWCEEYSYSQVGRSVSGWF